jgi:hypothetical protein
MNRRDQEKLLKEILPAEDISDFRNASLERGLAGLRHERRRRQVVRFSAALIALVGLSIGLLVHSRNQRQNNRAAIQPSSQPAPVEVAASHVDFISDDELLNYFTNEPVALVGKPGEQRLVFLGTAEEMPEQF